MILVNLKMIAFEALQAVEKNKNNFFIALLLNIQISDKAMQV